MKRNKYSAGAVKLSFWFMEFRKEVQLLSSGKTFEDIKKLSEEENVFSASTPARAKSIYLTITARIKALDDSFYQLFMDSDVSTQKLFALAGTLAHDTLFFDFVYEVIREKLIIGNTMLNEADFSIFFKNKQEQHEEIGHLALARTELDLDDGVKYNYRKVQLGSDGKFYEVLADSKAIMMAEDKFKVFKK